MRLLKPHNFMGATGAHFVMARARPQSTTPARFEQATWTASQRLTIGRERVATTVHHLQYIPEAAAGSDIARPKLGKNVSQCDGTRVLWLRD
jgi:hypothetical protein